MDAFYYTLQSSIQGESTTPTDMEGGYTPPGGYCVIA